MFFPLCCFQRQRDTLWGFIRRSSSVAAPKAEAHQPIISSTSPPHDPSDTLDSVSPSLPGEECRAEDFPGSSSASATLGQDRLPRKIFSFMPRSSYAKLKVSGEEGWSSVDSVPRKIFSFMPRSSYAKLKVSGEEGWSSVDSVPRKIFSFMPRSSYAKLKSPAGDLASFAPFRTTTATVGVAGRGDFLAARKIPPPVQHSAASGGPLAPAGDLAAFSDFGSTASDPSSLNASTNPFLSAMGDPTTAARVGEPGGVSTEGKGGHATAGPIYTEPESPGWPSTVSQDDPLESPAALLGGRSDLKSKVYLPGTGPFFDIAMKLGAFAAKLYRRVKPSKYRKRKDYASIELATMESRSMAATFLAAFGEPVSNDSRTYVTLVPAHAQVSAVRLPNTVGNVEDLPCYLPLIFLSFPLSAHTLPPPFLQDKQAAFSAFRASHAVMHQPIQKAARALVSAVQLLDTVVNVEDLAKYDPSGVLNMVVSFGHPMCRDVVNVDDLAKYDPSGVLNMVVSFGHPICRDDTVVNVEDLAKYDPSGVLNMVVSFGHPMCRDGKEEEGTRAHKHSYHSAVRLLDTVVNVEDLAKYDPSGVLNMVVSFGNLCVAMLVKYDPSGVLNMGVSFGHPMCRDGESWGGEDEH
ncbi:unnamed protein product [Closterium sp. Yama58-4]|nr:unnamed protein product [Closterium sp. Yama58-4]